MFLQGDLIDCEFEPGKQVNSKYLDSSDIESDDEEGGDYKIEEEKEQQVIRGNCILEMLEHNS